MAKTAKEPTKRDPAPSLVFKDFKDMYRVYHTDRQERRVWPIEGLFVLAASKRRAQLAYCEAKMISPKPLSKDELTNLAFEAMYGVQTSAAGVSEAGTAHATGGDGDDSGRPKAAEAGGA